MNARSSLVKALSVPGLAVALLASGCGTTNTVAAEVGSETVRVSDVELLARVQCTLSAGQKTSTGPAVTSKRMLRDQSLGALVDLAVFRQLAEEEGGEFDGTAYREQVANLDEQLAKVPAEDRERATELLSDYWKGVFQLDRLATEELRADGVQKPTDDEKAQASQRVYAEFREGLDIEVNPIFSPDQRGLPGRADGSMSVALSGYAKKASSAQPDPAFAAGLPAKLKCN